MEHVKAVIFDWAGTVVDYGSLAPMGAFVETFAEFGVEISIEEARGPMGMAKRPHTASLAAMPRIAEAWTRKHGRAPTDGDIDALYDVFVPKSVAVAAHYADVIPGAAEVVSALRAEGVQIGSSTGYTREIMAKIAPRAAEQGFQPDSLVSRRHARGSAEPADSLQGPHRSRRLAGMACDQGGRHDGRRRRRRQRRRLGRSASPSAAMRSACRSPTRSPCRRKSSCVAARGRRTPFTAPARIT